MKKTITLLSVIFLLGSCRPLKPLTGSYYDSEKPFTITTTKSVEEVWSKIIDLFATKGLSIKVIDKSSGLLTSEPFSFLGMNTVETENGTLANPSAWVVCIYNNPLKIEGAWNIRIKPDGTGKTIININITNLLASTTLPKEAGGRTLFYDVKSTGNFEKIIASFIN